MKTPTHREIADVCGVSPSTVSRALNRHHSIPEATRERILEVARGLGWEPNPLAAAYMSHLRSTRPPSFKAVLGAVVDYPAPHGVRDLPSHIRFRLEGFEQRAMEYGYQIECINLQDRRFSSTAQVDRALFNGNIPGFAILGLTRPREILEGLNWSRYACVSIGYSVIAPHLHRVSIQATQGFKLIIDRAFALGYRHIAVAASEDYDQRTNHGFLMPAALAKLNCKRGERLDIFKVTEVGRHEIEAIAAWLDRIRPELAVGPAVFEAIQMLGWRIPEDIAMATFDRSPGFPEHAGLDQRHEVVGGLAADVLVSEITHNRRGIPADPVEHTIRGIWVDGATAPPRA